LIKDLRTEIFRKMYDNPTHPKNLRMKKDPEQHQKVDEYYRENIRRLAERGTFSAPAHDFAGCEYKPAPPILNKKNGRTSNSFGKNLRSDE